MAQRLHSHIIYTKEISSIFRIRLAPTQHTQGLWTSSTFVNLIPGSCWDCLCKCMHCRESKHCNHLLISLINSVLVAMVMWVESGGLFHPPEISACVRAKSFQSCLTLCDPMDCSLPDSSVHRALQARILEWVAMPSCRRSSWFRDQTCVSYIRCTGRQHLYHFRHLGSLPEISTSPWMKRSEDTDKHSTILISSNAGAWGEELCFLFLCAPPPHHL